MTKPKTIEEEPKKSFHLLLIRGGRTQKILQMAVFALLLTTFFLLVAPADSFSEKSSPNSAKSVATVINSSLASEEPKDQGERLVSVLSLEVEEKKRLSL